MTTQRPKIQVTIMHDSGGGAHVHRRGCADIQRREVKKRSHLSHWDAEITSVQDAAEDAWSDFLGEESMTLDEAIGYTRIFPCVGELPEMNEPEPVREATPVVFEDAGAVRRLLVDACGMTAEKFEFIQQAVLKDGYCPFILGTVNYCLSAVRDQGAWQMIDVTCPAG